MCRLAYIGSNKVDKTLLTDLFKELEKSMGGDGNGVGGFRKHEPLISKSLKTPVEEFAKAWSDFEWDCGFVFHTRRASVGNIDTTNCHPFIWGNTITVHNGHIDGYGVLKLMMLENLEKYEGDGWTTENIITTADSDILAYFIWKRGFDIASMLDCGTVITMYPDVVRMYNGHVLEAIQVGDDWIYASEFSDKMGMMADQWLVFGKGTDITVTPDSTCILNKGYYLDGQAIWEEKQKKKRGKGKNNTVEVA